jgi:hypothetical protein
MWDESSLVWKRDGLYDLLDRLPSVSPNRVDAFSQIALNSAFAEVNMNAEMSI